MCEWRFLGWAELFDSLIIFPIQLELRKKKLRKILKSLGKIGWKTGVGSRKTTKLSDSQSLACRE